MAYTYNVLIKSNKLYIYWVVQAVYNRLSSAGKLGLTYRLLYC